MSCCDPKPEPVEAKKTSSCCDTGETTGTKKHDYFYYTLISIGIILYGGYLVLELTGQADHSFKPVHLSHVFFNLMNTMAWGIFLGIFFVGLLGRIPREYVVSILGKPGSKMGLIRATLAGLLLDLCSHGILLVGMKLYERGASLGQLMAFLIASPWNSISLTLILIALVGLKWTLVFMALSAVIALISGYIFDQFEKKGVLPKNPYQTDLPEDFKFFENMKSDLKKTKFQFSDIFKVIWDGLKDSKMIIKWVLLGAVLSSLINVFIEQTVFKEYFGPTLVGLGLTLFFTTIIEVCSEGATPLAADLINRAAAPGNSFTFLMAGVSTDYTEIMALRETTKSWKIALFLPLVTIPQILIISLMLNYGAI